jgi:hypothetical protein
MVHSTIAFPLECQVWTRTDLKLRAGCKLLPRGQRDRQCGVLERLGEVARGEMQGGGRLADMVEDDTSALWVTEPSLS